MRFAVLLPLVLAGCQSLPSLRPTARAPRTDHPATLAIPVNSTSIAPSTAAIVPVAAQEPAQRSVDSLHADAITHFAEAKSFVARLRRRETVNGRARPEELVLFKERKDPYGIHMKWIGSEANGREVLYVRGKFGDKLNIITAAGDVPFMSGGQRMALARDSMLVKAANPNHDISEAGMASYLRDLTQLYASARSSNSGVTTKLLGPVQRPEYPEPLECVEVRLPQGHDADLPRGGSRQIFYCTKTKLPVLYLLFDETGREQNYNCYDRIQTDLKLDDDDFDPDKLWGKRGTAATKTP